MRESFIFYKSFREALKHIPAEEQLVVYNAIADYSLDGTEPELRGVALAVFVLIKPQLDANQKRYENGKKGGRQKQDGTEQEPNSNQARTKLKPNVNDNVNVNGNDNAAVNDNVLPPAAAQTNIFKFYEQNIGTLSPVVAQKLEAWAVDVGVSLIEYAIEEAVKAGAANWKYIESILNNHFKAGRKSRVDAERHKVQRGSSSSPSPLQKSKFHNFSTSSGEDYGAIAEKMAAEALKGDT